MANRIYHKRSAKGADVPTVSDLELGELAINTTDGKLFTKTGGGSPAVVELGQKGAQGSAGDKGAQGAVGPQGDKGQKGQKRLKTYDPRTRPGQKGQKSQKHRIPGLGL